MNSSFFMQCNWALFVMQEPKRWPLSITFGSATTVCLLSDGCYLLLYIPIRSCLFSLIMDGRFSTYLLFCTQNSITASTKVYESYRVCDREACLTASLSTLDMALWVSFRGNEPLATEEKVSLLSSCLSMSHLCVHSKCVVF